MEKIDFKKQRIPFTQVANDVLNDPTISMKAKGLYAYIYSKPEGWNFAYRRIAEDSTDGKAGILSGLQELENAGYLTRERQPNGRVVYRVVFPPIEAQARNSDQDPKPEKATVRKSHSAKIGLISNKDSYKVIKTIQSNKERGLSVDWIDNDAWARWEQYRKEKKQKLTDSTVKLQLKMLEKYKDSHVAIIDQSIRNGWTGLFPLKDNKNINSKPIFSA